MSHCPLTSLQAKPSEACAKGGAGVHTDLIAREGGPDAPAGAPVAGLEGRGVVAASAFRTFYTPLNEQQVGRVGCPSACAM